jgi:hypothetical protein
MNQPLLDVLMNAGRQLEMAARYVEVHAKVLASTVP